MLASAVGACVKAAGQQSAVKPAHSKCEPSKMSKVQAALIECRYNLSKVYFEVISSNGPLASWKVCKQIIVRTEK
ncbi:MAG: hypothetical protein DMG05_13485 [Acidobacteria bacterium]|nr:MAG: hypothetical protein DMG05_13485 [Acidobacteriota bacterium]